MGGFTAKTGHEQKNFFWGNVKTNFVTQKSDFGP